MVPDHGVYHVVQSQQFSSQFLEQLFEKADEMEAVYQSGGSDLLKHKIMVTLFYEASTRTRLSFESAMLRLGGSVTGTEAGKAFSSAAKGETLEDTIRVVNGYGDVIVLRHDVAGAAHRASLVSAIPVINAGDGAGQHPTQALLDIYTIKRELGEINGITVLMVGDLHNGRTVHSLAYLLAKFAGVKLIFVAPPVVPMRPDIKEYLDRHNIPYEETDDFLGAIAKADVIYQTRIQTERFGDRVDDLDEARGKYVITADTLHHLQNHAIIMHPLPRVDELSSDVDSDPRAAYFRQAHNGLIVRMALLAKILS